MRTVFDRIAGRVTMYRLVLIVLGVLAAVSVLLDTALLLGHGWLSLLASLVVAVVATTVSSWLIARAFRTHAHLDSALITGLLLYFILPPPIELTAPALGVIALAGLAASASKFLIAWRGRHILNPAAAGALVVTLTGLTFSGWWVGTALMLPFVAVGAAIVLYRTRRVTIGVAFLVVATLTEVVRALVVGSDIGSMLQFAYLSFPLVFFAGFMLSEPLTLPPRRWQQLVVAALAGMLIALPSPTWISLSPQLALVVANVVAFAFGQRRGVRLELVSSRELAPGTREFTFRPLRPVRFHAGQYLELDLPHRGVDSRGRRRVFSISSAPTDEALSVAMSMTEKTSSFKSALATLPPGSRVHATAIAGDFTLPHAEVPVLLVAGGIGITPFASQLADDAGRDVTVVYASGSRELPYADVLERSGARVVLVAPERPDVLPSGWTYAGPDRISRELLERHVPDAASRRAFVSGPPSLVSDVARMLRSLGARRVTTDYFTGY